MEIIFYLFLILIIVSIPITLHYLKKPNHNASIKDLYAEGLEMLIMGKRKKAYKSFKLIIEKDSNNIKAYLYLGQVVRDGGSPKKALDIHQNLLLRKKMKFRGSKRQCLLEIFSNFCIITVCPPFNQF